jgi:hypothetical protein
LRFDVTRIFETQALHRYGFTFGTEAGTNLQSLLGFFGTAGGMQVPGDLGGAIDGFVNADMEGLRRIIRQIGALAENVQIRNVRRLSVGKAEVVSAGGAGGGGT